MVNARPTSITQAAGNGKHTIYIGIGSNLGSRLENCRHAIMLLEQGSEMEVVKTSSFYETEPAEGAQGPRFINAAIALNTTLPPFQLWERLQEVERRMGRGPFTHGQPRSIDLDILYFDDYVLRSPKLVIPHPMASQRAFVLVPLAEIAPDLVDPLSKKSIRQLLDELAPEDRYREPITELGAK